jgi:signal transduction histidine kinase
MADLDEVIDRLRTLVEELREASEDGKWYVVEDVIEELEEVINELQGIAVKLERQAAKPQVGAGGKVHINKAWAGRDRG